MSTAAKTIIKNLNAVTNGIVAILDAQNSDAFLCSGFIYNQNYVVTTASCVLRLGHNLNVVMGAGMLTVIPPEAETYSVAQAAIIANADYLLGDTTQDIAVLPVSIPAYHDSIQKVTMDAGAFDPVWSLTTGVSWDNTASKNAILSARDAGPVPRGAFVTNNQWWTYDDYMVVPADDSSSCEILFDGATVIGLRIPKANGSCGSVDAADPAAVNGYNSGFYTRTSAFIAWLLSVAGSQ